MSSEAPEGASLALLGADVALLFDRRKRRAGPPTRGSAPCRQEEFPYLAEVVGGHVAKVGYDFGEAFEYGLDLILDALEKRRDAS